MHQNKYLKYFQAINEALVFSMRRDKKMICYGLGVTDPKEVFSTTSNLKKNLEKIEFLMFLVRKML